MSVTTDLTLKQTSNDNEAFIHTTKPKDRLTDTLTKIIFHRDSSNEVSLHENARQIKYFTGLQSQNISASELLSNLVNDSKIFHKFEEIVRTRRCYQDIVSKDICRYEQAEKDILFFMHHFALERPEATQEVNRYIEFIDEIVEENIKFLPVLFFLQYGGLFMGRTTYNHTVKWLQSKLKNYNPSAEYNGVAFWNFNDRNDEALKLLSSDFYKSVNKYEQTLEVTYRVKEITKEAFNHILLCVKSSTKEQPRHLAELQALPIKRRDFAEFEERYNVRLDYIAASMIFYLCIGIILTYGIPISSTAPSNK